MKTKILVISVAIVIMIMIFFTILSNMNESIEQDTMGLTLLYISEINEIPSQIWYSENETIGNGESDYINNVVGPTWEYVCVEGFVLATPPPLPPLEIAPLPHESGYTQFLSWEVAIPPRYLAANRMEQGLVRVMAGVNWEDWRYWSGRILDATTGEYVIPPIFRSVTFYQYHHHDITANDTLFFGATGTNYRWGVVDREGNVIVPLVYDSGWINHAYNLAVARNLTEERTASLIDLTTGRIIIPFGVFSDIQSISEGRAIVMNINNNNLRFGAVDTTTGELVVPVIYNNLHRFSYGLAQARRGGEVGWLDYWGFIDRYGNEVIPTNYGRSSFVFPGGEWVALTIETSDRRWGIRDLDGNYILPMIYGGWPTHLQGINIPELFPLATSVNMRWGVVDIYGREILPHIYYSTHVQNGFAIVSPGRGFDARYYGLVCLTTKEYILPTEYLWIRIYEGSVFYRVAPDYPSGERQTCQISGLRLIPVSYERMSNFSDGISRTFVETGLTLCHVYGDLVPTGLHGFINSSGDVIAPPMYNLARDFSNGFAQVALGDVSFGMISALYGGPIFRVYENILWGLIDTTGEEVLPIEFCYIGWFVDGLAVVNQGGYWTYEGVNTHKDFRGGRWGVIDMYGNFVIPIELNFHAVEVVTRDVLMFQHDGFWGFIHLTHF